MKFSNDYIIIDGQRFEVDPYKANDFLLLFTSTHGLSEGQLCKAIATYLYNMEDLIKGASLAALKERYPTYEKFEDQIKKSQFSIKYKEEWSASKYIDFPPFSEENFSKVRGLYEKNTEIGFTVSDKLKLKSEDEVGVELIVDGPRKQSFYIPIDSECLKLTDTAQGRYLNLAGLCYEELKKSADFRAAFPVISADKSKFIEGMNHFSLNGKVLTHLNFKESDVASLREGDTLVLYNQFQFHEQQGRAALAARAAGGGSGFVAAPLAGGAAPARR